MNNDTNLPGKKHCFETGLNRQGNETQKLILKELQSLHKTIENGFLHMQNVSKKVNKISKKVKFLESYQVLKKLRKSNLKLLQKKNKKSCSQPKTLVNSFNNTQVNKNQDFFSKIPDSKNSNNFVKKVLFTDKKNDFLSKSFITHDIESVYTREDDYTFFTSNEQDYSNKLTSNCKKVCTTKQNQNASKSDYLTNQNISSLTTLGSGKEVNRKKHKLKKKTKKKDKMQKKKSKKSKKDKSKESKKSKKDKLRAKHKSKKKDKKLKERQYCSFDQKISSLVKSAFSLSSPKFVFEPLKKTSVESQALDIFQHSDQKYKNIESFSSVLYNDIPLSLTGSNTATTSSCNSENDIDIKSCDLNELENPSIVIETSEQL